MKFETIHKIIVSPIKTKKYRAFIRDKNTHKIRKIDFGASGYQQYKDSTGIGKYTYKDHGDKQRKNRYYQRHSGTKFKTEALNKEWKKSNNLYNAKILSHIFLW